LIMSQLLTLYTTPVVYLYMDRFRLWSKDKWERRGGRSLPDPSEA
jgi:multidrug efflux pump